LSALGEIVSVLIMSRPPVVHRVRLLKGRLGERRPHCAARFLPVSIAATRFSRWV
jgi:hypothetical protein